MTITIVYHSEGDGCWAESPDVQGFSAAADTLEDLKALARDALAEILGHKPDLDERYDPAPLSGDIEVNITGYDVPTAAVHGTTGNLHPLNVRRHPGHAPAAPGRETAPA